MHFNVWSSWSRNALTLTFLLCALHLIQHFLVVISDQMLAFFFPRIQKLHFCH